jgi:hypothetical protein
MPGVIGECRSWDGNACVRALITVKRVSSDSFLVT